MISLEEELDALDGRLETALQQIPLPAYLLDRAGTIRWLNAAALEITGSAVVGGPFTRLLPRSQVRRGREVFVRKVLGGATATDVTLEIIDRTGMPVTLELSSVPVRHDGRIVGVFGVAHRIAGEAAPAAAQAPRLTPRQQDVLRLLAAGLTTAEIGRRLHISDETVRNHIRALMRQLHARTRLQAVMNAQAAGLLARRAS